MGTRFLLTSDLDGPRRCETALSGCRPGRHRGLDTGRWHTHRVLRTGLVEKLESGSRVRGFAAAIANAINLRR